MGRIYLSEEAPSAIKDPVKPPKVKRIYMSDPEASKIPDVPVQNPLKSVAHGLTEFSMDVPALGAALWDWTKRPTTFQESARKGVLGEEPAPRGTATEAVRKKREEIHDNFQWAGFYREPVYPSERALSGVGRNLPTLPAAVAGLGPAGAVAETAATVYGPFVGEYTTQALTPEGQKPSLGAELAGTGAELVSTLPAAMVGNTGPLREAGTSGIGTIKKMRAARLAETAPTEAVNVLNTLNRRAVRMWEAMHRGSREAVPEAPQFDLADLYDIAAFYQGKLPVDADGNLDYAAMAADALDMDLKKDPSVGGRRPTQVLDRAGVPTNALKLNERALSTLPATADKWSRVVSGQQDVLERSIKQQFVDSLRKGTPQRFVKGAEATIEKAKTRARDSWKNLDLQSLPKVRIAWIEKKTNEILKNSRFQEDLLPPLMRRIASGEERAIGGEYLDMDAIQNLRSRLGAIVEEGGDGGEKAITAVKARELREHLDTIVDGIFEVKKGRNRYGQFINPADKKKYKEWLAARDAWRSYKELTDIDRLNGGDMMRLIQSKNPSMRVGATAVASAGDAERALQFAKSDRWTKQALERSVQDYILGQPNPNTISGFTKSPQAIRNTLSTYREGTVKILGEKYVKDLEELLDLLESAKPGAIDFNDKAASIGQSNPGSFMRMLGNVLTRAGIGDKYGATRYAVAYTLFREMPNNADAQFLMQVVAPDRELMRDLLRVDTKIDPASLMLRIERRMRLMQNQVRTPSVVAEDADIILEDDDES